MAQFFVSPGEPQIPYWSELVQHMKFHDNTEKSYVLEPPASAPNTIHRIEEVLKTIEFTSLENGLLIPDYFFLFRCEVKTRAYVWNEQYFELGLALGIFKAKKVAGDSWTTGFSPCGHYTDKLFCIEDETYGENFVCIDENDGGVYPFGPCTDYPSYSNIPLYLQLMVYSYVYWKAGPKPTNCTAYIRNIRAGGMVYYDQEP